MSEIKTNKISSLASNNDITIDPDGTGDTIIASGNVLIGTTDTTPARNNDAGGMAFTAGGRLEVSQTSGPSADFNRTNNGQVIKFLGGGTTAGAIGTINGYIYIGSDSVQQTYIGFNNNYVYPSNNAGGFKDNAIDLGNGSARFDDVYATNTSITTSDQNEKQQIASLTTAEITAAKSISTLFKTFKWNDKVEAKGDDARTHTGVIAQEVQTAMTDAGLDAADYAFWCSNTWWETSTEVPAVEADEEAGIEAKDAYTRIDTYETADEAPDGATQRTRMGIRYPELLAFVGAATEQRLADIETRLAALETE